MDLNEILEKIAMDADYDDAFRERDLGIAAKERGNYDEAIFHFNNASKLFNRFIETANRYVDRISKRINDANNGA